MAGRGLKSQGKKVVWCSSGAELKRWQRRFDPPLRWTRPTRETPKRQFDELRWERRPTRKMSAEELESITTCEAAAKDLKLVVAFGLIFAAFGCFIALVGGVARTAVPFYKRM